MVGVPVRVHDLFGDDLGVAHVPPPVVIGDLIALEDREFRVVDLVQTPERRSARGACAGAASPPAAASRLIASELASYLRIEERELEADGLS